jgi:ribosomal protein S7
MIFFRWFAISISQKKNYNVIKKYTTIIMNNDKKNYAIHIKYMTLP